MNRGDFLWRSHGNLADMAWCDKRPVYLISTIHPPENIGAPTTVQWRCQAGPHEAIPCPPSTMCQPKVHGWGRPQWPNS